MTIAARPAVAGDAPAIARIYNEGIADRIATFETEPRTPADIEMALAEHGAAYPGVVAETDGQVVAFAWTSPYNERACYAGVGTFSVYVAREWRGRGTGRVALQALIDASEAAGLWKLVSRIFRENVASRGLCHSLGFREVGVYRRHAKLEGEWRDCVIVEKLLGEAARG